MAEFPAFPLWTDAYLADTNHLSTFEHGAYLLLLIAMWRRADKRLPHDQELLAKYCGVTRGQWKRLSPTLMPFFRAEGEWIYQDRLSDEADFVKANSLRQSDKAKARWLKNKGAVDAPAMPQLCRTDAPTPTPIKDGADAPSAEKQLFDRGVEVLGPRGRGLIARLLKSKNGSVALARAAIEQASLKSNPHEYIGAVVRGPVHERNGLNDPLAGIA